MPVVRLIRRGPRWDDQGLASFARSGSIKAFAFFDDATTTWLSSKSSHSAPQNALDRKVTRGAY